LAQTGAAARRYAQAVFDIGKQAGTLDQWRTDLALLNQLFGNPAVADALEDPKMGDEGKRKLVQGLLARQKVQPLAVNLVLLLVERNRIHLMPRLVDHFNRMYNKEMGIVIAEVTTAVPLDQAHQSEVAKHLANLTGAKTVELRVKVDPTILGGIVAKIGDELIDASVASRLAELAQRIA
jgi:F-type H+-transporting ATPase subunit delta